MLHVLGKAGSNRNVRDPDPESIRSKTARGLGRLTGPAPGILAILFFLSGGAALGFEIVWFHLCGLVFGNSVWAASIVLASFMAGLALGNMLAVRFGRDVRRPLAVYAVLEFVIGGSGAALTFAFPEIGGAMQPLFGRLLSNPTELNAARVVACSLVLLVPTTAMGATLPILMGAVREAEARFGASLGKLYGWNTLGAMAGVLVFEVWIVGAVGIRGSAMAAAAVNCLVGAVALMLAAADGVRARADVARVAGRAAAVAVPLVAAFLAGAVFLALEVTWFRFLMLFVMNDGLALAIMLSAVLGGIGLGGVLGGWWLRRRATAATHAAWVALAAALATLGTYVAFQWGASDGTAFDVRHVAWLSIRLTLPTALLSGALFTLLGEQTKSVAGHPSRAAGALATANTIGAMIGALLAGFVLLPGIGMERSILLAACTYVVIAALAAFRALRSGATPRLRIGLACGLAATCVAIAWFPRGLMQTIYFERAAAEFVRNGERRIATRETTTETVFYMAKEWLDEPLYYRLVTNGYSMSGTGVVAQRYMRLFAYLPLALREAPLRDALIVSYGVGVTASAVTNIRTLDTIDVVDISADIVEMSNIVYRGARHPLHDPRVTVHIEDGRFFLQATSRRYDLITGEPPPPRVARVVNLYSREFFQLVHDRLRDGGVTTYWLPINDLLETDTKAIIRAFCDVFEDCSCWNGTPSDWILVGSRGGLKPVSPAHLAAVWDDPSIGVDLRAIGVEAPAQLGASFLGDAAFWNSETAATQPLTDDHPKRLTPLAAPPPASRFRYYSRIVNPVQARVRFRDSEWIGDVWSQETRAAADAYFEFQPALDAFMTDGPAPLAQIEMLHRVLTTTNLTTLALWLAGGNETIVRVARSAAADPDGTVAYALALDALAHRRYDVAASQFAAAEERGWRTTTSRGLRTYALCLGNRIEEARAVAAQAREQSSGERDARFWRWLSVRMGL